jgi:adenosylmethionine-8-amino-7-oxononanoate aminotransferase
MTISREFSGPTPPPAGRPFHLALFATAGVPQIVEGDGIELVATDGRRYLDACSGAISVNSLGYGNEPVVEAVAAQLRRLSYTMPFRLTNDRALELAAAMNEVSAGAIDRAMFYTGGSEAVEAALKLARNYHYLDGRAEKELTVARVHSYHGNTFAALSAGGVRQRREPYTPLLSEGPRVAMPLDGNPLDPCAETGPNVYGHGVADDLRELVEAVGPERISAFIMEPVGGAAAPGHAPAPGYFEGVREICDEYEIVLIADEVITGLGRTGRMFGSDHWTVDPDLWVCAKGLAAGYWPIAMVGMNRRISSAFADRDVDFVHGHTFENHAVGCAAALAVLEQVRAPGFVDGIAAKGETLRQKILALPDELPISVVRGHGMLLGIQLGYGDAHFDPADAAATRVVQAAEARDLMLYPAADATGFGHDKLIISPPYVISDAEIDAVIERFELALRDARLDTLADAPNERASLRPRR